MTSIYSLAQTPVTYATDSWVDHKNSSNLNQTGFHELLNSKSEASVSPNENVNDTKSLQVSSFEKRLDTDVVLAQLLASQKMLFNVNNRSIRSVKHCVNSVDFNESACDFYESINSIFYNDMQVELIQSVCSIQIDSRKDVECRDNLKVFLQPPVFATPVPVIYYLLWIAFEYISYKVPFSSNQKSRKRKVTSLQKTTLERDLLTY